MKYDGDRYAQKKREEAYGFVEPKKSIFKRPPPRKGRSVVQEMMEEMAHLKEAEKAEKLAKAQMAAKVAPMVTSARGPDDLDYQMGEFMMGTHGIRVEKEVDHINDRVVYRFIDPATKDYYSVAVDERMASRSRQEEIDAKWAMMDAAMNYFACKSERDHAADALRYTDVEGRTFVKNVKPVEEKAKHREGHFPTHWVEEALDRAEASEKCVTLTLERKGVMIVATEGDDKYSSHVITWAAMEHAEVNPLPLAIEDCEKKLALLSKIKAKVK